MSAVRCAPVLAARAKLVVEPPVHRECEIARQDFRLGGTSAWPPFASDCL